MTFAESIYLCVYLYLYIAGGPHHGPGGCCIDKHEPSNPTFLYLMHPRFINGIACLDYSAIQPDTLSSQLDLLRNRGEPAGYLGRKYPLPPSLFMSSFNGSTPFSSYTYQGNIPGKST